MATEGVEDLAALVASGDVVVLSGAGISTASGLPDYRGESGRTRTAPPMQWHEFATSAEARDRYWARGQLGVRRFAGVVPNAAHRAVADLQRAGLVTGVVTQNVDGLHQQAGATDVLEVHGSLRDVVCMVCGAREPRRTMVARVAAANPWLEELEVHPQADGDAVLDEAHVARFRGVDCGTCNGALRPDVVFFGEFVPRSRMLRARHTVEAARTLLVLGSSLAVGSGYLLVRHARRHGAAVAIVNIGATRGDPLADLRLEADVVSVMRALAHALLADPDAGPVGA